MRPATAVAGGIAAAGLAHMLPSTLALGQWMPVRAVPGCVWRGLNQPRVAITFDDGPAPGATERVLDRLDELGLRTTFFCLGSQVERHPDLAREVVRRGHQLATHGFRHISHFRRSPLSVGTDLDRVLITYETMGLPRPRWYRPPYGHVTAATLWQARRVHLRTALWSAMGREWVEPSAEAVAARVIRSLTPGAIVLLHDYEVSPGSARRVLDSLPIIADEIGRRGWQSVSVDELVEGT